MREGDAQKSLLQLQGGEVVLKKKKKRKQSTLFDKAGMS